MAFPNILFVMTDQQRFDTIAALGNSHIYTPNLDRLVRRGVSFTRAYSTCPVCVPARYTIRTGCEPPKMRYFSNAKSASMPQDPAMEGRCGPYLARTMGRLGYRTFGIGKFHTSPWNEELGYDVHLHSEELYHAPGQREGDAYAAWIAREHPHLDGEALMGERTEMYYQPQRSAQPAEATVERWAADRAVEQICRKDDDRPWFGLVSFIGPHPPCAPPVPFNRLYNPDRMPEPILGEQAVDHMDEQIPYMNHLIWADELNDFAIRLIKSRYYGEITYIDDCLGRILDAVEQTDQPDNTLICFFSDHGDHLGDHHAWQKESFFEQACHIPFLLSWPTQLPADTRREELVCLTDLFGIATQAAGRGEFRDGCDVLGMLNGSVRARKRIVGLYGEPGTPLFKCMIRESQYKYIFIANGGHEQLFDPDQNPQERRNIADQFPEVVTRMRREAIDACRKEIGSQNALDRDDFKIFEYQEMPRRRIAQFDTSRGAKDFPNHPADILRE